MAEGLFIRVTNAATEGESVLLTDIFDATDGAAHQLTKAGAVYVAADSSVDLAYTADVARSFENGCIRGMIDAGTLSASFGRGSAAGETIAVVVAHGVPAAISAMGKVTAISVATAAAIDAAATINIDAGGGATAIATLANINSLDGVAELALEATADDVESGDTIIIALAAAGVEKATVQITFATADA